MKILLLIITISFFCNSCTRNKPDAILVDAYVPIYLSKAASETISLMAPQPIEQGGKIAKLGRYLFQVENNKGIHVIDVINPSTPLKKGFISIPLCQELTLKGSFLYTNNNFDLVVINLTDINSISVSSRIRNAFPDIAPPFPSQTGIYFECADPNKGVVIGWEIKNVLNPKCKR